MKPNDEAYKAAILAIKENGPYYAGSKIRESMAKHLAEVALPAAYAAQFPPSKDYAGLIKLLRSMHKQITSAIKQDDPWGIVEETIPSKAADALEAVLADRDELMAVNAEFSVVFKERDAAIAERDALAARLAPVDDEKLVEICAKGIASSKTNGYEAWMQESRAAIAAIRPHIEAAAYDDAATFIDENVYNYATTDQNYWTKRKGDNANGLEYAKAIREKAAATRSGR